jgi:hypothetical protein
MRRQRVASHWPVVRDLDEQTELGAVYMRSFKRAQFRLALVTGLVVLTVVGGLPLLFACAPGVARLRPAGLPLPWVVLGGCIQPLWVVLARWHVRRAERVERDFADVVARS